MAKHQCWECGKKFEGIERCFVCNKHVCTTCKEVHKTNCEGRNPRNSDRRDVVPVTQIWRINLKPGSAHGVEPRAFCLEKRILGVGWQVECTAKTMDYDAYFALGAKKYRKDAGWAPATKALKHRMQLDDLCWTRDLKNIYYLGRITGEWEYRAGSRYRAADIVNLRKCDWVEVGKVDAVPGKIINSFIPGRTVQTVAGDLVCLYSQFVYNKANRGFSYPVEPLSAHTDVFQLLSSEDMEDVFAVWLQTKGYLLIGSSRRADTPFYEYVLKHRSTGRDAVAQVKHNETLNRDEYADFPGEVHLLTTSGNYIGKKYPHVHCANPKELWSFVLENRNILPARVRVWLQVWDELSRN